jgi:hypothetical protein
LKEPNMRQTIRHLLLATLAVGSAAFATIGGASPAAAFDYPYCLQGKQTGIPGDCSYRSYRECQASASGRDAYCNINPAFAYRRSPARGPRGYPDYYND